MMNRWQNQEEAVQFALSHSASMMDMDMGTGKTRVALDVAFERSDVRKILVVCPKAVLPVWSENLAKFHCNDSYMIYTGIKGTVKKKAQDVSEFLEDGSADKMFVVVNYDIVWRAELGDLIYKKAGFDMVILDESHRAKSAGSKVSKYLAMLGKKTKYKMCLSGTPMANSPLDVYGQYRFLDNTIFGTNHHLFLQEYAIMGGADLHFIVGFKNQKKLNAKFNSIAYHCKMSDIADRLKLPEVLPPTHIKVSLPAKDIKTLKDLAKEFIAECGSGHVIVNNVLTKMLRMQQICSGFCLIRDDPFDNGTTQELNSVKENALADILEDISPRESVAVFCTFRHDLEAIKRATQKNNREYFELSGSENTLGEWKKEDGGVIGVQIQAGSEGVDMTKANYAIYFSVPHSLAMYNQSKARLYRPGQTRPVTFNHIIAENTIDEAMYNSLMRKEDVIESIKAGTFDFGYTK